MLTFYILMCNDKMHPEHSGNPRNFSFPAFISSISAQLQITLQMLNELLVYSSLLNTFRHLSLGVHKSEDPRLGVDSWDCQK